MIYLFLHDISFLRNLTEVHFGIYAVNVSYISAPN